MFKDIATGKTSHTTMLDSAGVADYRTVIGYFAHTLMKDLRLVSGYDVLYGKIKAFVQTELFGRSADLESPNALRNLAELAATKTVIESFKKAINELTVQNKGYAEIRQWTRIDQTRSFMVKRQDYIAATKSVFNRIIGDSQLELRFARFLENCSDVASYTKNYFAINFKLDYVNADGDISNYYSDFVVKLNDKRVVIVETKGQVDLDVPLKMERLKQWCADVNAAQSVVVCDFVFVDEEGFGKYNPPSLAALSAGFRQYNHS